MNKKKLQEQRDILLVLANHVMDRCKQHVMEIITIKDDPLGKILADFTFKYNIHSFVSYFVKEFVLKHPDIKVDEKNTKPFIDKWQVHLKQTIQPLFLKEIDKIQEKFKKPKVDINELYA